MPAPRIAFYTLGCKVNQYDTMALAAAFGQAGFQPVEWDATAEVYLVNSCAVTGRSEAKARQAVRRLRRRHPGALIVLAGCLVEANPQGASQLAAADLTLGTGPPEEVVASVQRALGLSGCSPPQPPSLDRLVGVAGRTRAQLKIQDGCDAFCTYCVVPLARSRVNSRPAQEVVAHAQALLAAGYRELVLTGVRLGTYGRDGTTNLAALITQLNGLGDYRLRLSSLEPEDVTQELVTALAGSAVFCRHLHLPLQSGSDAVLERMGRAYRREDYRGLVGELRNALPGLAVSTDVIVGFPQETAMDFAATLDLVQEMSFSRLHVFRYSPRPGTAAAEFGGQVPPAVKRERSTSLGRLGAQLALAYHQRYLSQRVEVLAEQRGEDGAFHGLTRDYVRVHFPGEEQLTNRLLWVQVKEARAEGLWGQLQ